jgi:hypothetical protein
MDFSQSNMFPLYISEIHSDSYCKTILMLIYNLLTSQRVHQSANKRGGDIQRLVNTIYTRQISILDAKVKRREDVKVHRHRP